MSKRRRRRRKPPGTPPGTLELESHWPKPRLTLFRYGPDHLSETEADDVAAVARALAATDGGVLWVNVDGLGDEKVLRELASLFGVHRLALEDVVHLRQRPKVEPYADHVYVVLQMGALSDGVVTTEQVSLFFGRKFVLTLQEHPGDVFNPVRERIRAGRPQMRRGGADYLAYALVDAVVDGYFPIVEAFSDRLDTLEEAIAEGVDRNTLSEVNAVRRDLLGLRRRLWPTREALSNLRSEEGFLAPETQTHLRDCHDHAIQLLDMVETQRELSSGLTDYYLSTLSHRMNEVMKVLTMIATIFIPLSFIAGLYGMNFDPSSSPYNMPELRWYLGYPGVLTLMAGVAVTMLVMFRRKGWF